VIADGQVNVDEGRDADHAIEGGDEMAQLLLGSEEPAEIIAAAGMHTSGDATKLAAVLFPNQYPNLCLGDRY